MTRRTITPFPFQGRAVKASFALLRKRKKVLVVSPGGSGKTVMISLMAHKAVRARKRVLVVSHRREIITQTYAHLKRLGVRETDIGVIRGEVRPDLVRPDARVQVASIAALLARGSRPAADLVIVDECHHALAPGYARVLRHYRRAQHVGFTATPHRLDGRGLGDFYDEMIIAAQPSELIKQHMLLASPIIFKGEDAFVPDLKAVRVARGDYVLADLEGAVMKKALIGYVPKHYLLKAKGRKAIGFAVSIAHSQRLTARCIAAGIRAVHIDGLMPVREQEQILRDFRAGKHDILFCCMVLAEGLDIPECDAVILARPTKSLALYLQQTARAMRRHGNIKPIILDHCMHWKPFADPDADRPWALRTGKANESVTLAGTMKGCPHCHRVHSAKDSACPGCGYKYPPSVVSPRSIPEEIDAELRRLSNKERQKFLRRVHAFAVERGLSLEWEAEVAQYWGGRRRAA